MLHQLAEEQTEKTFEAGPITSWIKVRLSEFIVTQGYLVMRGLCSFLYPLLCVVGLYIT
jgi:hypothetical protein